MATETIYGYGGVVPMSKDEFLEEYKNLGIGTQVTTPAIPEVADEDSHLVDVQQEKNQAKKPVPNDLDSIVRRGQE